jgi:FkbM family methyltransferase
MGVVHVGANLGQEIPSYIDQGKVPVLAFEPLPDVYEEACRLHDHAIRAGLVRLVNVALGERTEELAITVARDEAGRRDTLAASGLGVVLPDMAVRLGWMGWVRTGILVDSIAVPCYRFEDWARAAWLEEFPYSSLVVDVQGMELEVLKGFGEYLQSFSTLAIECSARPVYAGEATAEEVVLYLIQQGYRQITPTTIHGDILFTKEAL